MKKTSFVFLMLLVIVFGYSQEIPVIKVNDKQLGLSSLDIKVEVVGNIATTTYDMLFYNTTNSVLEGELSFPLGEGHNVSRFALDVNGKLREAVVVDKELGRIAFEQVVRRGVDPALLEKGTGNNYKARIYPIPAKGYKRVLVAYEQELVYSDGGHFYNLPLNFKNKLDDFKLEIVVFDQKSKPVVEKGRTIGLVFSNWEKNYRTSITKKDYIPNRNLLLKIPVPIDTEKLLTFDDYFYIYKTLSPRNRLREKPNKIALFWDASLSMENRNLEKEMQFLQNYFSYLSDVNVCFISFSNSILSDKEFVIKDGNWDALKKEITETIYDGGTNYDVLSNEKNDVDVKLLFSDGITSLSDNNLDYDTPVFIVNSLTKANHSSLNYLAESSNGAYINLNIKSHSEALSGIKYESYKFLGYKSDSKILEVYPKAPISISNDFSVSGKNARIGESLILYFGYENEIIQSITISTKNSKISNKNIRRIWAQKKLDDLEINPKENKTQITKLGTDYSLVTDYTSLIVLEDVRDYLRYKITPPEELLEEYNRILALKGTEEFKQKNISNRSLQSPLAPDSILVLEDEVEVEEVAVEALVSPRLNSISDFDENEAVDVYEIIEEEESDDSIPFSIIESAPNFPGCEGTSQEKRTCLSERIKAHIINNFNLDIANNLGLDPGIQRINAIFTINAQGNVENIRVRSSHTRLSEEIKRIIRLLPQFTPGKQRGESVKVKYTLPIIFRVDDNGQVSNLQQGVSNETSAQRSNTINYKKYNGNLTIKDRIVSEKYLLELSKAKNKKEAYQVYLKQRKVYLKTLAYYIDVSNYFKHQYNDQEFSSRILSNIAEADFDNYELLKAFAYQLQVNNQKELALFVFKRILDLRPEDAQSYRDLALAFEEVGECQEALDLYNSIITGEIYKNTHRRVFKGVELIAKNEIKYLIQKYKNDLDLSKTNKEFLEEVKYDIRVIVDWNHNDTDIDLHIIDPNKEECFYSHNRTNIGGRMSPDMTQGFGPEEFTLKNAIKGGYYIKIKYYGDRYQKVENPTFMKVTIFKNYGIKRGSKETKIIRLTKNDDEEIIAKINF